jgi:Histone chaperone Rttp106-like
MDTTTSQKEAHAGSFDLQTCSAKDLATALISSRGKEDAVQILQQATKLAEQQQDDDASSEEHQDATAVVELGDALLSQPVEMSFVAPRLGKFQVRLHQHGLVAVKATDATQQQQQVVIESSNISHVLVFPKPEDCKIMTQPHLSAEAKQKKLNGCLVFLQLAEEMVIQKKSVAQLCFALPSDKKTGPVGPSVETEPEEDDPTTQWCRLLKQSLVSSDNNNNNNKTAFARIQPGFGFKSFQPDNTSTTSGGMPFVKCYMGVNDGVLYPLEEGLLFFKPPKFVPRSDLRSIACGRGNGGGQSSSRYVDMVVQLHNDTNSLEFSNIQREENGVLNQYIHKVLVPAMQADAENEEEDDDDVVAEAKVDDDEGEESLAQAEEGGADEESEDDDEDFDEEESAEGSSDGSDDGDDHDEDDDVEVVQDDFAKELAKEKRKKQQEDSATESENDDDDDQRRMSKRLRRNGDE